MNYQFVATGAFAFAVVFADATPSMAAVNRTRFKGNSAEFSSFESTPVTCADGSEGFVDRQVFIQGFAQGVRSTFGDSDTETVFVFFSEFDSCTGESSGAFVFDDAPDYDQNGVNSASISGEYELTDFNGEPAGALVVDLEFAGVGDVTRQNSHSVTHSGQFHFNSRFSGTFRQATVSGTLSLDGEDISTTNGFAQLSDTRSGDISVTH